MIELASVWKTYEVGRQKMNVLQDVSLFVARGEFVSLMGPSGSGKSTLMHIMGLLDVPTSGSVSVAGQRVENVSREQLARVRNQEVGFVFQNFHLLPRMTALRNVELPLVYAGENRTHRLERARELLDSVGLLHRADHYPNELSGGQKQRVAIARALANEPSLILADEPTGALDSTTGREIMELFQRLNETGVTIVLVTHDTTVANYAQRMIRIKDGRVVDECESV